MNQADKGEPAESAKTVEFKQGKYLGIVEHKFPPMIDGSI